MLVFARNMKKRLRKTYTSKSKYARNYLNKSFNKYAKKKAV